MGYYKHTICHVRYLIKLFSWLVLELYSLGQSPWPGVADSSVMPSIQQRTKMSKPAMCPEEMYELLLTCWRIDPASRPTAAIVRSRTHEVLASGSSYTERNAATLVLKSSSVSGGIITEGQDATSSASEDEDASGESKQPRSRLIWPQVSVEPSTNASSTKTSLDSVALDLTSEHARSAFSALETPRANIVLLDMLGSGAFGEVRLGELMSLSARASTSGVRVAIKCLKHGSDSELHEKFLTEARILALFKHPHIVKLVGVCSCEPPYMMIIELMPQGDLLKSLRSANPQLSVLAKTLVAQQTADAMHYLERCNVIHRDLAARFDSWGIIFLTRLLHCFLFL